MFATDTPVNVNELLKNIQPGCDSCKPSWYDFTICLYHTHTDEKQKIELQGMPYGVKKVDKEKGLIIYCYDKETINNTKGQQTTVIGYQLNVIWVLTLTSNPDTMKKI